MKLWKLCPSSAVVHQSCKCQRMNPNCAYFQLKWLCRSGSSCHAVDMIQLICVVHNYQSWVYFQVKWLCRLFQPKWSCSSGSSCYDFQPKWLCISGSSCYAVHMVQLLCVVQKLYTYGVFHVHIYIHAYMRHIYKYSYILTYRHLYKIFDRMRNASMNYACT